MRTHLESLLVTAKVDVALWGHHQCGARGCPSPVGWPLTAFCPPPLTSLCASTYQRTCPVQNETCTAGAPVHLVIGMAGYDLTHNLTPTLPPYMEVATDKDWGYTRFLVNSTHMVVEFVADSDAQVRDTLVLAH